MDEDSIYSLEDGIVGLDSGNIGCEYFKEAFNFLKKRNSIILFEDSMLTKSDITTCKPGVNYLYKDDRVFTCLQPDNNSIDNIELQERYSSNAWQNVFFFSFLPDNFKLEKDSELSDELIDIIGKNAVKAFVDAYDLDSYLCWEIS